jgi:hypothetical protein
MASKMLITVAKHLLVEFSAKGAFGIHCVSLIKEFTIL